MTTEAGYSTLAVAEAVGASYRQLDYWARTGLIVPSISGAQGPGTARRYSFEDAVLCRLVVVLGTERGRDLPRGGGLGCVVREALAYGPGWYVAIPAGGAPIVTCEPAGVIAEHHTAITLVALDSIRHHVTTALGSTAARSASEPGPPPAPEAERGAAGTGRLGEVAPGAGCTTTTNEDDLRGAIPEVVSIA